MNRLRVVFNPDTIAMAIHMRNKGKELKRESKLNKLKEIEDFKQPRKQYVKNVPRYERTSLPKPWDEVTRAIMRYVTLKGQHKTIYAYQFAIINHCRHPNGNEVNFPFFIFHSMMLSIQKCKENQDKLPRHQGVIKLVYNLALAQQPPRSNTIQVDSDEENTPLVILIHQNKRVRRKGKKVEFSQPEPSP